MPLSKASSRSWQDWLPLLLLPAAALLVPSAWPRWALMWTLAFAIYCGCKWLTWRRAIAEGIPLWRHLGYLLAWPGMDAVACLHGTAKPTPQPSVWEWLFALSKTVLAVSIVYGLSRWLPTDHPYLVGWAGMIGMVLFLHFGVFHLLSCGWRSIDVDARPLMNWPLAALSVSEFWGKRWNVAFRDLTHRFVFRPLLTKVGPRWAIAVGFVFSGLVHDLVISIPAGGGYGRPTLFFLLQGLAVFFERSPLGTRIGLGSAWRGRLFTLAVLLAPACLLFHPPFVIEVVVPFMRAIGAIHD